MVFTIFVRSRVRLFIHSPIIRYHLPQLHYGKFGRFGRNCWEFLFSSFTCFSIFQTILDGLAKFQCSPNILTMKKIGSNSIFLYSQYYEKTYFSLPPIAVEIPALMDRSSQAISENTILWWSFETLCVQFQMEISIALSNITWLMSSMTSMTVVRKI